MPRSSHRDSSSLLSLSSSLPLLSPFLSACVTVQTFVEHLSGGHSAKTWKHSSDQNKSCHPETDKPLQGGVRHAEMGLQWPAGGVSLTSQSRAPWVLAVQMGPQSRGQKEEVGLTSGRK